MAPPSSPPSAAGLLLAVAIVAGAGIGIALGQPSAGLVIGTAAGALLLLGQWLLERRGGPRP